MLELPDNVVPRQEDSFYTNLYVYNIIPQYLHFRLFSKVYDEVLTRLKKAYEQILHRIGDPLEEKTLVGPLHSELSVLNYKKTIEEIKNQGGTIEFGGKVR